MRLRNWGLVDAPYLNCYRDAQDDPDFDAITETILDSVRMDST